MICGRDLMETGEAIVSDRPVFSQSLKRLGLDYVDIFYHHRMDLEVSLLGRPWRALAQIVRSRRHCMLEFQL